MFTDKNIIVAALVLLVGVILYATWWWVGHAREEDTTEAEYEKAPELSRRDEAATAIVTAVERVRTDPDLLDSARLNSRGTLVHDRTAPVPVSDVRAALSADVAEPAGLDVDTQTWPAPKSFTPAPVIAPSQYQPGDFKRALEESQAFGKQRGVFAFDGYEHADSLEEIPPKPMMRGEYPYGGYMPYGYADTVPPARPSLRLRRPVLPAESLEAKFERVMGLAWGETELRDVPVMGMPHAADDWDRLAEVSRRLAVAS